MMKSTLFLLAATFISAGSLSAHEQTMSAKDRESAKNAAILIALDEAGKLAGNCHARNSELCTPRGNEAELSKSETDRIEAIHAAINEALRLSEGRP
jgi:hypothetical protein